MYTFYVICDLNWSLKLATDYAKQVEHKISQTPVGWERRDAFGTDRQTDMTKQIIDFRDCSDKAHKED